MELEEMMVMTKMMMKMMTMMMMKMMTMMMKMMTKMTMMRVSPAFVAQQDEEQETEDAGQPTVDSHQKRRGRAVGPIAATTLTCRGQ